MATFFDIQKAVLPELQECSDCQKHLFAVGDAADCQEKTQGGEGRGGRSSSRICNLKDKQHQILKLAVIILGAQAVEYRCASGI